MAHYISNSAQSPPNSPNSKSPSPNKHVNSSSQGYQVRSHGDPSPNINHVFVEDCTDEDDFDSSEEDCTRRSNIFTSPVPVAPSTPAFNFVGGRSVPPPACTIPPPPGDRHATIDVTVRGSEPLPSTLCNFFANNRNIARLTHIPTSLKQMTAVPDDDLDNKYDLWKLSLANVLTRLGHQRDPATVDPLEANLTAVAGPSPPQIESVLVSDRVPAPGSSD
ncbi:hypothetical protein IMY05_007G0052700 [Salix suchowensis]|nr:hypothetical protein IMY05_007G0052700 [Salix suchowensis]